MALKVDCEEWVGVETSFSLWPGIPFCFFTFGEDNSVEIASSLFVGLIKLVFIRKELCGFPGRVKRSI